MNSYMHYKIHNIAKHLSEQYYQANSMPQMDVAFEHYSFQLIENLPLDFLKNVVPKESFSMASDIVFVS